MKKLLSPHAEIRRNKMKHICILMLGSCLAPAQASVIFDNLLDPSTGSRSVVSPSGEYQSFSTGPGGFVLGDVTVALLKGSASAGSFTVGLYADSSTSPGALLDTIGSMNDSALLSGINDYDFPVAPTSLAANTRFWIGLTSSNSSTTGWSVESPFTHPSPPEIGVSGEFVDDNNGVKGVIISDFGAAPQMRLSSAPASTAAPEPASLVLVICGLASLRWMRGRRKESKS